jgi:hypothetical protein
MAWKKGPPCINDPPSLVDQTGGEVVGEGETGLFGQKMVAVRPSTNFSDYPRTCATSAITSESILTPEVRGYSSAHVHPERMRVSEGESPEF